MLLAKALLVIDNSDASPIDSINLRSAAFGDGVEIADIERIAKEGK